MIEIGENESVLAVCEIFETPTIGSGVGIDASKSLCGSPSGEMPAP
jgi:hypothetical protein